MHTEIEILGEMAEQKPDEKRRILFKLLPAKRKKCRKEGGKNPAEKLLS
jgi:hypothetical protein